MAAATAADATPTLMEVDAGISGRTKTGWERAKSAQGRVLCWWPTSATLSQYGCSKLSQRPTGVADHPQRRMGRGVRGGRPEPRGEDSSPTHAGRHDGRRSDA